MNKKQEVEEKIQKLDQQINYMRQVAKDKKYPQGIKRAGEKSLDSLLKERDDLIGSLCKEK